MITIVLGTRPEIIKMSPVIRACMREDLPFSILHTGQHHSYAMDRLFFEDLALPEADINLDVGSGTHGEQTGKILTGVEKVLSETRPGVTLVQGDTNTVMAAALAATKLHLRVGHVEAGLRSFDRRMPEEINRVVTDHIADYLFAPTRIAEENLLHEGISQASIVLTGNTIVDAVFENLAIAKERSDVMTRLDLHKSGYILVTAHRAENVDDPSRLAGILEGVRGVWEEFGLPVIYPVHPRTDKMVQTFGLSTEGITCIPPIGFLDFLVLEAGAHLILTDSGGVQEEACILHVPCVTMRDSTERPETICVGANLLAGTDAAQITATAKEMSLRSRDWENPFGDSRAGARIVEFLTARGCG
jgi:UDP-N-acetylglucosamine 2-epimerase (non-hydrolysing)